MNTSTQPWHRDERGSVAVELAVIAPAFVALMLLVVFAGRISEAEGTVQRAATEAARAASLRQHAVDAAADAEKVAEANLSAAGVVCIDLQIDVDSANFQPGGSVTVEITCVASMADVTLLGVPGTRTFTARTVEIIDRYRSAEALP